MEGGIPSLLLTTPDDSGVRYEKKPNKPEKAVGRRESREEP